MRDAALTSLGRYNDRFSQAMAARIALMGNIRNANARDVPEIAQIVNDCAEYGLMLHRSHAFLYERLRDFHVAVAAGDAGGGGEAVEAVVGVCGLRVIWSNLAEVYALAVLPQWRGRGLGRKLVEVCVDEARRLGIRRLMSLTYEQPFFEKLGFAVVDRQTLPLKVWSECLQCPKNQACDEIAMVRVLGDVPDLAAASDTTARPPTPAPHEYVVPVVLRTPGAV
jgi:amino-acid N-acetyltransferase